MRHADRLTVAQCVATEGYKAIHDGFYSEGVRQILRAADMYRSIGSDEAVARACVCEREAKSIADYYLGTKGCGGYEC